MRRRWMLCVLAACAACATSATRATTGDPRLEARVRDLEREVARLEADAAKPCKTTASRGFADGSDLSKPVAFGVRTSDVRPGDAITIQEVHGDHALFEVNGVYVVRGTYTLASADEAELAFTEQTEQLGLCSTSSGRDKLKVTRGTGTFELATALPFEGMPHLYFAVKDHGIGGVVFGHTASLAQRAENAAARVAR